MAKEKKLYVVVDAAFEYNDQYSYPTEGAHVVSAYQDKAEAEAEARRRELASFQGLEVGEWAEDRYQFYNLDTATERETLERLIQVFGLHRLGIDKLPINEREIENTLMELRFPDNMTQDEYDRIKDLIGLRFSWVTECPVAPKSKKVSE